MTPSTLVNTTNPPKTGHRADIAAIKQIMRTGDTDNTQADGSPRAPNQGVDGRIIDHPEIPQVTPGGSGGSGAPVEAPRIDTNQWAKWLPNLLPGPEKIEGLGTAAQYGWPLVKALPSVLEKAAPKLEQAAGDTLPQLGQGLRNFVDNTVKPNLPKFWKEDMEDPAKTMGVGREDLPDTTINIPMHGPSESSSQPSQPSLVSQVKPESPSQGKPFLPQLTQNLQSGGNSNATGNVPGIAPLDTADAPQPPKPPAPPKVGSNQDEIDLIKMSMMVRQAMPAIHHIPPAMDYAWKGKMCPYCADYNENRTPHHFTPEGKAWEQRAFHTWHNPSKDGTGPYGDIDKMLLGDNATIPGSGPIYTGKPVSASPGDTCDICRGPMGDHYVEAFRLQHKPNASLWDRLRTPEDERLLQ